MKVDRVGKYDLHQQLLVALDDGDKVAFVLDRRSLDLLIDAVLWYNRPNANAEVQVQLLEGMQQLRDAVFKEPTP